MVSNNTREKDEKTRKTKGNKNMKERGITLIALVVTIIVLLILAGISIQMLMGDSGILKKATEAATKTDIAEYKEQLDLLGVDLLIDETVGGKSSTFMEKYKAKIEEEFPDAEVTKEDDNSLRVETEEGYVFKVTEEGAEYLEEEDVSQSEIPPLEKGTILYADIDNDDNHTPDAVIYADLSVGRSGKWNPNGDSSYDEGGTYSYTKETGTLKDYKVVKKDYEGTFGIGDVIAQAGSDGADRYYAMALSNVDSATHCWYYSAYNTKIEEYSTEAPTGFGTGKTNTKNMIDAWKLPKYGSPNGNSSYPDMWGLSTVQDKYNNIEQWFIPSREEWAAFGDQFNIASNYSSKYKLSSYYWSSSLYNSVDAWSTWFLNDSMRTGAVSGCYYVRLSVTF